MQLIYRDGKYLTMTSINGEEKWTLDDLNTIMREYDKVKAQLNSFESYQHQTAVSYETYSNDPKYITLNKNLAELRNYYEVCHTELAKQGLVDKNYTDAVNLANQRFFGMSKMRQSIAKLNGQYSKLLRYKKNKYHIYVDKEEEAKDMEKADKLFK